jgi:sugar phosphate isomerase/epimerase
MISSDHKTTSPGYAVSVHWLSHVAEITAANLRTTQAACVENALLAGASAIEVPIAHASRCLDAISRNAWREMSRATRASGLRIVSAHGPTFAAYDRSDPVDAARPIIALAHACAAAEIPVLVVHPSYHPALHVTTHALRSLTQDVQVAQLVGEGIAASGVRLAIENVPHNNWRYLAALFDRIDHPSIGMCFDTGHYQVRPEMPLDQIMQQFGKRIIHVHLSDNDGLSDQHLPPGAGVFPWAKWLPMLRPELRRDILIEVSVQTLKENAGAVAQEQTVLAGAIRGARRTLDPILDSLDEGRLCVSR